MPQLSEQAVQTECEEECEEKKDEAAEEEAAAEEGKENRILVGHVNVENEMIM